MAKRDWKVWRAELKSDPEAYAAWLSKERAAHRRRRGAKFTCSLGNDFEPVTAAERAELKLKWLARYGVEYAP